MLQNQKLIKMRFILRVTSYLQDNLLLDGWTDLHETMRVYSIHCIQFDPSYCMEFLATSSRNLKTGSWLFCHEIDYISVSNFTHFFYLILKIYMQMPSHDKNHLSHTFWGISYYLPEGIQFYKF